METLVTQGSAWASTSCVNDQVMCGMGIEGYTPTCGVAQ